MNVYKKLLAALLAVLMVLTLCSCGGNNADESGTATYQVKVLDGQGNPCTNGVIVKFFKDGAQVAMQAVNGEGIAAKELDKGDYTVDLAFTTADAHYSFDKAEAVLSASTTSIEISLINVLSGDPISLYTGDTEHAAYAVTAGKTEVSVAANKRNYFTFSPAEAGTYKVTTNNSDLKVGYYGMPQFIQPVSAVAVTDNAFNLSISASMVGGGGAFTIVIGIDGAAEDAKCVLSVIRTGDPAHDIAEDPWTEYAATHTPAPYTLSMPSGKSLTYIDITGKAEDAKIVFNETDGYYHFGTADGPVMLINLGRNAPNQSLEYMLKGDGHIGGAPLRTYIYDEDGNFVKKEDYTNLMLKYLECKDATHGVYPLNDDLIYILKSACKEWWDKDHPNYIFEGCNPEIGWMFALCYVS